MAKWIRWLILIAPLSLEGCDRNDPSPLAYSHWEDRVVAIVGLRHVIGVCSHRIKINDHEVYISNATDKCYQMQPPRAMRGIWLDEFEGSRFFENATSIAEVFAELKRAGRGRNWPFGTSLGDGKVSLPYGNGKARLVQMEFVGRRTAYDGQYGGGRSEVLFDRMRSAKTLYTSKEHYIEDELSR